MSAGDQRQGDNATRAEGIASGLGRRHLVREVADVLVLEAAGLPAMIAIETAASA